MNKQNRLVILKFIHLHRMINKEAKALGVKENEASFFHKHPDFTEWNKLRIKIKKLDPKWLEEYVGLRG